MKLPHKINHVRKRWLFGGVLIGAVVLIFSVLTVIGLNQWKESAEQAKAELSEIKQRRTAIINAKNKQARLAAISEMSTASYKLNCNGSWWSLWQERVFSDIKQAKQQCEGSEKAIYSIQQSSNMVNMYLSDDKKMSEILKNLAIDPKKENWQKSAMAAVTKAKSDLDTLKVSSSAETVRRAAAKQVEEVSSSWNVLAEASSQEDRATYIAASARLSVAYANLAGLADTSDAQLTPLIKQLLE